MKAIYRGNDDWALTKNKMYEVGAHRDLRPQAGGEPHPGRVPGPARPWDAPMGGGDAPPGGRFRDLFL